MATRTDQSVYRGDNKSIVFAYTGAAPTEVRFYVRTKIDGDLLLALKKSTHTAQIIIDDTAKTITVALLPADTSPIEHGDWVYDIDITQSGVIVTLNYGLFQLQGDIATVVATDTPPTLEYHVPAGTAEEQILVWDNTGDEWDVRAGQATETVKGIAELATAAEVATGADTQRIVTPSGLANLYINKLRSIRPQSLVGFWPLNEASGTVAADESKNGHVGAYLGTYTLAQSGRVHVCPSFTSGFVNIYSAALAAMVNGQLGSAMIWLQVANVGIWTDGALRVAWELLRSDASNAMHIAKSETNNILQLAYIAGGTSLTFNRACSRIDWICAGMTWNLASNRFRCYIDGIQPEAEQSGLGTYVGSLDSGTNGIGAYNTGRALPFIGKLAYAVLWNAELSPAEMYNASLII